MRIFLASARSLRVQVAAALTSTASVCSASEPPPERTVTVRAPAPARSASEVTRASDVLAAAPHRTASDMMAVVPGLSVTQHSGEGKAHQIFYRGFDAEHGQDLAISVAGIPVNDVSNIHGQGYADLHFVMPEVVQSIKASPGSYAPQQGDFAVAGSLAMQLAYDEPGLSAKTSLGSFGARRLLLAFHPEGEPAQTFAAFEAYSTEGFGPNRAASRGSLVAQVQKAVGPVQLRAFGSAYSGRFDAPGVLRAADIESGRVDRFATLDPKQGGSSERTQMLVELVQDKDDARLQVAAYGVLRSLGLRQNFTGYLGDSQRAGGGSLNSDNTQQLHDATTFGLDASYLRRGALFSAKDTLEVGVSARADSIAQSQRRLSEVNDAPVGTWVDAEVRASDVAGYVDASLHASRALVFRGGVRADVLSYAARDKTSQGIEQPAQERSSQGMRVGKKITADLLAAPGLHVLASYGEGFRSPQARALSNDETTPFTTVQSAEVGARYAVGNRVQCSLAIFRTELSQDLVFDPQTARNERTPGTARTGATLDAVLRPRPWFTVATSATYTHAAFSESDMSRSKGELMPYVPQWVVRSDMRAAGDVAHVGGRALRGYAGLGLSGLLRRPMPYGEFGRDVFLASARMGARLGAVELGLDVTNLLGADWYDGQFVFASNFARTQAPSLVPASHVTSGEPRAVMVSATLFL